MFIFDILFIILQFVVYRKITGKYINHISVFNAIWLLMTALSKTRPYGLYLPSINAYLYVYTMLIIFNIVSVLILQKRPVEIYNIKNVKDNSIRPNYFMLILSLFSFMSLIKYIPMALQMILASGFSGLRSNYLAGEDAEMKLGVFITWFVNSLILAGITDSYLALSKTNDKKVKRIALYTFLINIVNVLIYVCITGGRFLFVLCIFIIIIETWMNNSGKIKLVMKKNKKIVLLVICFFIITIFITSQRVLSGLDFWGMLYVYFYASINMFSILEAQTDTYSNYLYGTNLIGGFITPFILLLNNYLGSDFQIPLKEINEYTSDFVWVSNYIHMNNNCTFLYGAIRDFGSIGVVIYAIIYALVVNLFYKKSFKKQSIISEGIYVYILALSVFLLMEWMPCRPNIFFTPIFIWLIPKFNSIIFK